jgi:valyl-tRNA synthetase
VVGEATSAFDEYDHARSLRRTESTFWWFCDNYLELVKHRAYGSRGEGPARSANAALRTCLSTFLRLFAPHMPFVTEEAWSWWREGSVHRARWPEAGLIAPLGTGGPTVALDIVAEVLAEVRKAKTAARLSQVAPVDRVVVRGAGERLAGLHGAVEDLRHALTIGELDLEESADSAVLVALPAATASDRA